MRISALRPIVLGTPWRNLAFLIVETDEGLSGVGEVRMVNHTDALLGYLQEAGRNHIIGSDPRNIEDLVRRMFRNDFARCGEVAMSGSVAEESLSSCDLVVIDGKVNGSIDVDAGRFRIMPVGNGGTHAVVEVKTDAFPQEEERKLEVPYTPKLKDKRSMRDEAPCDVAPKAGEKAKGAVLASDAFFPFPDGLELALAAGVTAVVQPGGSVKDADVIAAADRAGAAMIFTGARHFRH